MNKKEFGELFAKSLELAADNAEEVTKKSIPRCFKILLYGARFSGAEMSPEMALDALYIDENNFYRIIDLAVVKVEGKYTTVFTRVSSHQPTQFELTWNQPNGFGPFKQIISEEIKFE